MELFSMLFLLVYLQFPLPHTINTLIVVAIWICRRWDTACHTTEERQRTHLVFPYSWAGWSKSLFSRPWAKTPYVTEVPRRGEAGLPCSTYILVNLVSLNSLSTAVLYYYLFWSFSIVWSFCNEMEFQFGFSVVWYHDLLISTKFCWVLTCISWSFVFIIFYFSMLLTLGCICLQVDCLMVR